MGMADKTSRAALRCNVRYLYDPRRTVADGVAELLWIYRKYIYVCGYSIYTANNSKLFSPESLTASSYIPVRKLINKIFKCSCRLCNLIIVKVIIYSLDKSIKL